MSGIQWYPGRRQLLDRDIQMALEQAAEAVKTDLVMSQTVPYAEDSEENRDRGVVPGELQSSIYADCGRSAQGVVSIVANTPYARRLYYHPEYNYYLGANPHAGGLWFRAYMRGGRKAGFARKAFADRLRAIRSTR